MTGAELRRVALALPEVAEQLTWGTDITFRVRDKIFVIMGSDEQGASIKASLEDQDALIHLQPETFSVAAYTGRYGWVSVDLTTADPELMRDLIVKAWKRTASKRLVAAYEAQAQKPDQ